MYNQHINDYELLYLIYQKDDESLELLMKKYENIMYMFFQSQITLMYHIKNYADVYQIGRIVIWKALNTYRLDKDVSFRHYYLFLLKNEMRNILRKQQAYFQMHVVSSEYLLYECNGSYLDDAWKEPQDWMQADWIIQRDDIRSRILKLESYLSEIEKKIFRLRIYGYTYQEIAQVLHIPIKKVDNTLYKVRNHKV